MHQDNETDSAVVKKQRRRLTAGERWARACLGMAISIIIMIVVVATLVETGGLSLAAWAISLIVGALLIIVRPMRWISLGYVLTGVLAFVLLISYISIQKQQHYENYYNMPSSSPVSSAD